VITLIFDVITFEIFADIGKNLVVFLPVRA